MKESEVFDICIFRHGEQVFTAAIYSVHLHPGEHT